MPRDARLRCTDDAGSVVAEFALIAPFLVTLVLGVFEFGMLFRQQIEFSGVVQSASRSGSHVGKARSADQTTLTNLSAQISGLDARTTVTRVVIYSATVANGSVPSTCTAAPSANSTTAVGVAGVCNIYSGQQMREAASSGLYSANCSTSADTTSLDRNWCPLTRKDSLFASPDQFGVQVEADYAYITKLFGIAPKKLKEHAVFRIEVLG